jgi:hypothetical protein
MPERDRWGGYISWLGSHHVHSLGRDIHGLCFDLATAIFHHTIVRLA